MAKTQEDLLIKIQADLGESSKSIALLSKRLDELSKSFGAVQKSSKDAKAETEKASKSTAEYTAEVVAASVAGSLLASNFSLIKDTIKAVAQSFTFMNASQAEFGAIASGNVSVFKKMGDSFSFGFLKGKEAAVGFGQAAKAASATAAVGFISMFEAAALVGPAMVAIGAQLQGAQDATIRLSGKVLILAGLLSVSLVAGVVYVVEGIGRMAEALGDSLIISMEKFSVKANEMQTALSSFTFTLAGFSRELGVAAVGSLEGWNDTMKSLVATTTFTTKEVMKATSFLVKEGTAIGLSVIDNTELLKRGADIAAANVAPIEDVTQAMLNGLKGQSQALFNLGIDISEAALGHSKYVVELGKTVEQMTGLEKQQARYALLMEKSNGLVGAAANATLTAEGANIQLGKSIEALQVKLGAQGFLTSSLNRIQAEFLNAMLQIPDVVVNALGTLQDFAGVILKVGGLLLKNVFLILTLKTAYTLLSGAVASFTIVQGVLNFVFGSAASLIGVQVVQVTALSGVYANLLIITRGLIASFGTVLLKAVQGLGIAFVRLIVIMAPIIAKIALVASVVYGFAKGFQELAEKTVAFKRISDALAAGLDFLKNALSISTLKTSALGTAFSSVTEFMLRAVIGIKEIAKIMMIGLVQTSQLVVIAWLKVKQAFADDNEVEGYAEAIKSVQDEMFALNDASQASIVSLASFMDGTAMAAQEAEALGKSIAGIGGSAHETADELAKIVAANMKGFNLQNEKTRVMGTEFERASLKSVEAMAAIQKAQSMTATGGEKGLAIADATKAFEISRFEAQKLANDTLKGFREDEAQYSIQRLKDSGEYVQAVGLESDIQRKLFEDKVAGLKKIATLTAKQKGDIEAVRASMKKQAEDNKTAAVAQEPAKEFQVAAKSGNDLAKTISGAMTGGLSGVGGMITGMMSGAGAVMAAADGVVGSIQGVIDFIPKILNSVANVFSSLADLPLKILDGVKNLMGSLVKVVTDLIPNLFSAVPDILFSIIDTIFSKLPAAIMNLVKSLPDLIMGFIDRIPEIVTELISGLISAVPTLVISLATSIIGNIPKIVIALAKAAAITIPKAIIKGIMDGLKQIAETIKGMFGGGLFGKKKQKLEFDTKSITESMKKAASALTGETSKLFKVMDLTGGDTKSAEKTKENISAIESAGTRSRDWLMQAWDKVVAGFGNLMTWFGEVWHQFLRSLKEVWMGIFQMFSDIFNVIKFMVNGVITALFEAMDFLMLVGDAIVQGVTDGLAAAGSFFNDLGGQISEGFWEGLQGLGAFFTNMFDSLKLGNLFEKLFKVDYKGRGYIEQNVINTDIPFMNFAKGGMVPGNAQVTGDSLMNDRVLAMISPGEAIIPRSKMNDPFLSGLIRGVLDGTITPPKFKMGGVVGSVVEKTKETGGQVADAAQVAAQQVQDLIASLNPSQITAMVREKILKEMIPAMLSANKFHTGGIIGGSGDVPILGQAGEFVMQRSAVSGIGQGNLAQMNKTGSSSVQGNTSNVYNIDIKVDAKTAPDEKFIRGTMVPIIKEELRRASLDGQRVLFQQGIRA